MTNIHDNSGNSSGSATDSDAEDNNSTETDFHGAAIIDEKGNEIPITEEMIQKACKALDEDDRSEDADA